MNIQRRIYNLLAEIYRKSDTIQEFQESIEYITDHILKDSKLMTDFFAKMNNNEIEEMKSK